MDATKHFVDLSHLIVARIRLKLYFNLEELVRLYD